jgi:hypothetical protein
MAREITVNEIGERLGLSPLPGACRHWVDFGDASQWVRVYRERNRVTRIVGMRSEPDAIPVELALRDCHMWVFGFPCPVFRSGPEQEIQLSLLERALSLLS